jgi:hypothetical protein
MDVLTQIIYSKSSHFPVNMVAPPEKGAYDRGETPSREEGGMKRSSFCSE